MNAKGGASYRRFYIEKTDKGKFTWKLEAQTGKFICQGSETLHKRAYAIRSAKSLFSYGGRGPNDEIFEWHIYSPYWYNNIIIFRADLSEDIHGIVLEKEKAGREAEKTKKEFWS